MVQMRRRRAQRDEECREEQNAVRTRSMSMQNDPRDQNQAGRGNEQGRCLRSMGSPPMGSPPNKRARPKTRNASSVSSQDSTTSPLDEGVGILRRSEGIGENVGDAPERSPALFDEEVPDDGTLERNLIECQQSPVPSGERDTNEEIWSEGMDGVRGMEEEEDLGHINPCSKNRKIAALTPVKEDLLAELSTPERYIVQLGKVPVEIPALKPLLQLAAGISEYAARVAVRAERHFEFRAAPKNFRKATVPVWDRPNRAWKSSCLEVKYLDACRALDVIEREMYALMASTRQLQERVEAGSKDSTVQEACEILSLVPMGEM